MDGGDGLDSGDGGGDGLVEVSGRGRAFYTAAHTSQASFTIPCSTPVHRADSLDEAFPVLAEYERHAGPSRERRRGYERALKGAQRAFEVSGMPAKHVAHALTPLQNTLSAVFTSTLAEVDSVCARKETPGFYIPGSSTGALAGRLSAAALVGPQLSLSLQGRLRDVVEAHSGRHWVILHPRECSSLAATIRLVVARLTASLVSDVCDTGRLSSLSSLSAASTVVIHLHAISLHKHAVLNDFVQALYSVAQQPDFPRLVIVLGLEGGTAVLDDKMEASSLELLEIKRFTLCSPQKAFDVMMQQLFLNPVVELDVWLGPSVLEFLRYQYFERGFDLDKAMSTITVRHGGAHWGRANSESLPPLYSWPTTTISQHALFLCSPDSLVHSIATTGNRFSLTGYDSPWWRATAKTRSFCLGHSQSPLHRQSRLICCTCFQTTTLFSQAWPTLHPWQGNVERACGERYNSCTSCEFAFSTRQTKMTTTTMPCMGLDGQAWEVWHCMCFLARAFEES